MLKKLGIVSMACLAITSTPVMADTMVDHYFTSMQLSVDAANELGPKCMHSLNVQKAKKAKMTNACVSFNQAYGIVLDQADRLNQQLASAHRRLPAHDPRLAKLQSTTKKLNGYASIYDERTGQ